MSADPSLFVKNALPMLDGIVIVVLPIIVLLANGIIFITITHFAGKELSRPATSADLEMLKDNIPDDNNASGRSVKAKKGGFSRSKKGGTQSAVSRKKGGKKDPKSTEPKTKKAAGFAFDVPEKEDVGTLPVGPVVA